VYPLKIVSSKRFKLFPISFIPEKKKFFNLFYIAEFKILVIKVGINVMV